VNKLKRKLENLNYVERAPKEVVQRDRDRLSELVGELERVEKSISHLLKYAREEDLRSEPLRMAEVLDSALETFRDRSARSGVEIVRDFDGQGALCGDPDKLRRVFINLVGNAIDALEQAGVEGPQVEVALGENLACTEVWVRVRDNGPGLDPDQARELFRPFASSKEGGTGLGLAITRKLVDAHGGDIEVGRAPQGGAEFTVTLPRRSDERSAPAGRKGAGS